MLKNFCVRVFYAAACYPRCCCCCCVIVVVVTVGILVVVVVAAAVVCYKRRQPAPTKVIKLQGKQSNRCGEWRSRVTYPPCPGTCHPPSRLPACHCSSCHDWIINLPDNMATVTAPASPPSDELQVGCMNYSGRPICYCPISVQQCECGSCYCYYYCCCCCLWTCLPVAAVSPRQIAALSRDHRVVALNFYKVISPATNRCRYCCCCCCTPAVARVNAFHRHKCQNSWEGGVNV